MKSPRRARRLALQALCCLDVQGERVMDLAALFITDSRDGEAAINSAMDLLEKAWAWREQSDQWTSRHARHWELGRLALVDRNILRLAVYEMLSGRTAPKIAITEALRLAQEFSTAESPRFVNGILDAVYKEMQTSAKAQAQADDDAKADAQAQGEAQAKAQAQAQADADVEADDDADADADDDAQAEVDAEADDDDDAEAEALAEADAMADAEADAQSG